MKFNNSCDGFYKDSLDVRFTKVCDNHCPFCIERHGLKAKPVNVDKMIENTIASGKKDILILGGEPLIEIEKVLHYISAIRKYVNHIYITTSLPKTILSNYDIFSKIMNLIDGLNVSLQHYDYQKNNEVLCASSNHNRINLLEKICSNNSFAEKCRISINLVKNQIDTKTEIDNFLTTMENIGVRHVKINELQNEDQLYVSFEKVYGYKMKSPYSHGCQGEIYLDKHNIKITLKRACFCVNKQLQANLMDFAKAFRKKLNPKKYMTNQVVLYEDGTLSNGWISY